MRQNRAVIGDAAELTGALTRLSRGSRVSGGSAGLVLDDIHLEIEPGMLVGVVGTPGS